MKEIFGGIMYATMNRKIGSEMAKATVDRTILEGTKEPLSSLSSEIFFLFLRTYTVKDPIPRPKKATDIAIKAKSYHRIIEKILVSVSSNRITPNETTNIVMKRKMIIDN
jgi:hypothetical protein